MKRWRCYSRVATQVIQSERAYVRPSIAGLHYFEVGRAASGGRRSVQYRVLSMTKNRAMSEFVGLISDTHGVLRPEAVAALSGASLILHAGDIGRPEVLEELKAVAPVLAVRGNNDRGEWAEAIPERQVFRLGAVSIYLLHDVKELDAAFGLAGHKVVISGHSHKPSVSERAGVLYVNPGSAGPRRFKLPVSIAHLRVKGEHVEAKIIELPV